MSYRFMRVVVFFDLPTETSDERRDYRHFRKALMRHGFVMMQESVYSKIVLNSTAAEVAQSLIRQLAPKGLVQMLVVTERQFERMEIVSGSKSNKVVDTDERFLIL